MLVEVESCGPALTLIVVKCYEERPADALFRMDPGEHRTTTCSKGVQQGDRMGPAMCCLSLRPGLKRFRAELEGEGDRTFAYVHG